jgi:hypothetical protein
MKEIVALTVFLLVCSSTIFLAVKKQIGSGLTAVFLVFSLFAGLAIANYDLLREVKWEVPGLALFRNEVDQVKEKALEELRYEAESQKLTIQANIGDLNATSEKLDTGIKYAEALLESIKKAEEKLKVQELNLKEQTARVDQAAERGAAIYGASADLALLLTKAIWLQFQARDDSDVKRRDLAVKQVMDQLDVIVGAVIEDPEVRSEFINSVMRSLPPRQ